LTTDPGPGRSGTLDSALLDTPLGASYDDQTMELNATTMGDRADQLRSAMRAWTTGVTVVTASHAGRQHGMTVSSFTSASLDPPQVIISLSASSQTHELVRRAGAFGVTILAASQWELSERFAGRLDHDGDRLEGLQTETFVTGAPFLKGGLAFLDCRISRTIRAGMNTVFIADVVAVRGDDHDAPLVYHDRAYRRLEE
jgi:flavin reductase (DIM6/NTAB) family NADH-FMN oxidoreductase RutF